MNVSTEYIQKAFKEWESGNSFKKHYAYLRVFHPTNPDFRFSYFTDPSGPDISSISFSVDDIRTLANEFSFPEGFLNYLQRFRRDLQIETLSAAGKFPNACFILRIRTSKLDLYLLSETILKWASNQCVTEDPEFPIPFEWILDNENPKAPGLIGL